MAFSNYRLQSGYAFSLPVGHGWRYARDSKWATVVQTPPAEAPRCLGFRSIDGATCAVFRVDRTFYAQTCVACHVRQPIHFTMPGTHKRACGAGADTWGTIDHAQVTCPECRPSRA